MSEQPALTDVTAHCFFSGSCRHTETGHLDVVHAAMERHYASAHEDDFARASAIYQMPRRKRER